MRHLPQALRSQLSLIENAMKEAGVWSNDLPQWVIQYNHEDSPDIWQWLQFIYLPMRMQHLIHPPHYLAPVIRPFLEYEPQKTNLLQLVIELDSITSTFIPPKNSPL